MVEDVTDEWKTFELPEDLFVTSPQIFTQIETYHGDKAAVVVGNATHKDGRTALHAAAQHGRGSAAGSAARGARARPARQAKESGDPSRGAEARPEGLRRG